ncbi:MAG: hypothetical protein FD127_3878 [Acidimicrobiaceae bacterium]|nr:MAG: hypothetical protein FD127_3878 [Acidimicrobiaceae bacterium]
MTLLEAPPLIEPVALQSPPPGTGDGSTPGNELPRQPTSTWVPRMGGLAALVVGLAIFGIFAVTPDGSGFVQGVDSRLSATLHIARWQPTSWSAGVASPALIAIGALVAFMLMWEPKQLRRRRWSAVTVTFAAGLIAGFVGMIVARPSPGHLGDLTAANATSFPSVAAAMATGLAIATVRAQFPARRRHDWMIAVAVLVVAVPITVRLATASTWPLDEAAGILIGVVVAQLATTPHPRTRRALRPHQRRVGMLAGVAVLALVVPIGRSYLAILTEPGSAPFDQRSVEWLRDHGMSEFVDRGESWWLWQHLPSPTATIAELPAPPIHLATTSRLPAIIAGTIQPALPGEGRWSVAAADTNDIAQIATTYLRPDPSHPSLVAGVAWINSATTRISMIAGTRQPGGGAGPAGGHVPDQVLPSLLAVFNSGYKMKDTPGGALIEGRTTRHMVDGLATFAITPDGIATVGEWGTTVTADQGYTSGPSSMGSPPTPAGDGAPCATRCPPGDPGSASLRPVTLSTSPGTT